MYFKEECIGVICNNCLVNYEQRHTGYCMFVDKENVHPEDDDWHVDGDVHYCPDCHKIDDNDSVIVKSIPPVFRVIAEFPNNKDFPVGKLIRFEKWNGHYWQHKVEDCQGERTWLSEYFEKMPHLFKRVYDRATTEVK